MFGRAAFICQRLVTISASSPANHTFQLTSPSHTRPQTTLPGGVNVFQDDKSDLEGGGATIWLTQRRSDRATAIYYIACHRLEREQFSRAMALLQSVQSRTKGVVVVANIGLHYNERPEAFKVRCVIHDPRPTIHDPRPTHALMRRGPMFCFSSFST